jgi:membrane-associated phospholipid phosphatase
MSIRPPGVRYLGCNIKESKTHEPVIRREPAAQMTDQPHDRETPHVAGTAATPETDAPSVVKAVKETLSPTAPGQSDSSGVVVDLSQVVPPTTSTISRLSLIGIGSGVLFAVLSVGIARHGTAIQSLDNHIHAWVVANRGSLDRSVARGITKGGLTTVTLPALIIVGAAAIRGQRAWRTRLGAGLLLAGVASIGVLVEHTINSSIGRARPPVADWAGSAGGAAFPSGHTTAATLFAAFSAWALTARFQSSGARVALWTAAGVYAIAVGWSRVWLGVHWPSDVLGAWLYGLAWAALAAATIVTLRRRWPRPSVPGVAITQPKGN